MKTTFLQRNSTLRAKTGFKRPEFSSLSTKNPLKRSKIFKKVILTPQEECDKVFSEYVRLSHANGNGWVQCVTCGITRKWNDRMDAGHFIPRQHLATRYDTYNVFCQCQTCNRGNNGRIPEFTEYFRQAFGELHVEELKRKAQQIVHNFPYRETLDEYQEKLRLLKERSVTEIEY